MSRLLLLVVASLFAVDSAHAISRYVSTSMTCEAARARVEQEGAVIFRFPSARNPSHMLYDRFVRHGGYCSFNETIEARDVPTANGSCTLMICGQQPDDPIFWRRD